MAARHMERGGSSRREMEPVSSSIWRWGKKLLNALAIRRRRLPPSFAWRPCAVSRELELRTCCWSMVALCSSKQARTQLSLVCSQSSAWSLAERSAKAAAVAAAAARRGARRRQSTLCWNERTTTASSSEASRGAITIIIIQLPPPPSCRRPTAARQWRRRRRLVTQRRSRRWTTLPPWFSSVRSRQCQTLGSIFDVWKQLL